MKEARPALCASAKIAYQLYRELFGQESRHSLYQTTAPLTFFDLMQIVGQHVLLQFSKLTDPAKSGRSE